MALFNWQLFFIRTRNKLPNTNEGTLRHAHIVGLSDASRFTSPFATFFYLHGLFGHVVMFEPEVRFESEIAVMQTPFHFQIATRKATDLPYLHSVLPMTVARIRNSFIPYTPSAGDRTTNPTGLPMWLTSLEGLIISSP